MALVTPTVDRRLELAYKQLLAVESQMYREERARNAQDFRGVAKARAQVQLELQHLKVMLGQTGLPF